MGGGIAYTSLMNSSTSPAALPGLPNASGLFAFAGVAAGAAVAFQGLLLAAVGQVLWLMASVAYQSQLSNEYMDEVVRRLGNAGRK